MGGGGGTLNNTRSEHLSVSKTILNSGTKANTRNSTKSSLSHCTISQEQLSTSHVVCDRGGSLYNKEALVSALLEKRAPSHIRSLKKDVTIVNFNYEKGTQNRICPVTFDRIQHPRKFVLWWECGCVTRKDVSEANSCPACTKVGFKVQLGCEKEQRENMIQQFLNEKKDRKQKRKRNADKRNDDDDAKRKKNNKATRASDT